MPRSASRPRADVAAGDGFEFDHVGVVQLCDGIGLAFEATDDVVGADQIRMQNLDCNSLLRGVIHSAPDFAESAFCDPVQNRIARNMQIMQMDVRCHVVGSIQLGSGRVVIVVYDEYAFLSRCHAPYNREYP